MRRSPTCALLVLLFANGVQAAEPLPNPLTLEQALTLAGETHPDLDRAQARVRAAEAGVLQAESLSGFRSHLDLTPQSVLPALRTRDDMVDDSRARVYVSKRLYDFGRSRALEASANLEKEARELSLTDARQRRRLEVQSRFLDVLLADLRYAVDNENMAFHYVTFDKQRIRHELGQISDVDLAEHESRYQDILIVRTRSQKRQVQSRQQLALALNRPDQLPADLALPAFPGNDREPPEFNAALEKAMAASPVVTAARKDDNAAREAVSAEKARRYPVLSVEGEAAWYERNYEARDDLRATLNLRIPLWQGGEDRAAIGQALARQQDMAARRAQAENELRQAVLDLVQEIESLRVERNAAKLRSAWRNLYLDRSRALYELEVRTDLGDAMTRMTEAQWRAAQVEFQLAMAWARLEALTGPLTDAAAPEKPK